MVELLFAEIHHGKNRLIGVDHAFRAAESKEKGPEMCSCSNFQAKSIVFSKHQGSITFSPVAPVCLTFFLDAQGQNLGGPQFSTMSHLTLQFYRLPFLSLSIKALVTQISM